MLSYTAKTKATFASLLSSKEISYNSVNTMKIKAALKHTFLTAGTVLTAVVLLFSPFSNAKSDCFASESQTVVRWKDMFWYPCKYSWKGICFWPIRRKHITYKVTVNQGIPMRDEDGAPIPIAEGKIRNWAVYDAATWNGFEEQPSQKRRFPGYEPIADNEYVVLVETRYRLFNKVEDHLRICTQK